MRTLARRERADLLGMYLGDGCISEHPRAFKLRISCADSYPKIMDEVAEAMQTVCGKPAGRVKCEGCTEVNAYWQHWPCVFPQHGPGVKHERKIELVDWQLEIVERYPRPLLRGLIQSDGWRGKNVAIRHTELAIEYRTYTRYQFCFCNHSDDILKVFCDACDAIDVHWTQANRWTISVARREDVFYLDSFIGPKR